MMWWLAITVAWGDLRSVDSLAWSVSQADLVLDCVVQTWGPSASVPGLYALTLERKQVLHGQFGVRPLLTASALELQAGERVILFARKANRVDTFEIFRVIRQGDEAYTRDGEKLIGLNAIAFSLTTVITERDVPPIRLSWREPVVDPPSLVVPADRSTESMLKARLSDPALEVRAQAAGAIRPFESLENIEALLALTQDTATFPGTNGRVVCIQALATLQLWEVPVEEPVCT